MRVNRPTTLVSRIPSAMGSQSRRRRLPGCRRLGRMLRRSVAATRLPARQLRRPEFGARALAVERQLEPAGPLWLGQVIADAFDCRPVARPDDLLVRLFELVPARAVVLVREARLGFGPEADRKDGRRDDPVDRRLVELVDQVEVVERLDVGRPEAGLL